MGEEAGSEPIAGAPPAKHWVTVRNVSDGARERRAIETAVAMAAGVPLTDARALLSKLPVILPRALPPSEAEALVGRLLADGADASASETPANLTSCTAHAELSSATACERCERPICTLCVALAEGATLCPRCSKRKRRSRGYFMVRITVLLLLLVGVLLYAWADVRRREARKTWKRPLNVAVVLVQLSEIDPEAVSHMRDRLDRLEEHLDEEMLRYRPNRVHRPFQMSFFGPVSATSGPPAAPTEESGVTDLAAYSWDLWRYVADVDDRVGLESKAFDSRIYLVARPPGDETHKQIEGLSEQDGRIGIVEVDLDSETVDFALFVATHELFHTLGANDKYDAAGFIIAPDGLAEPNLEPLYPQRFTELMARHRATGPSTSAPPESIAELHIGSATAREIHWSK